MKNPAAKVERFNAVLYYTSRVIVVIASGYAFALTYYTLRYIPTLFDDLALPWCITAVIAFCWAIAERRVTDAHLQGRLAGLRESRAAHPTTEETE
ncbi:hypothetical protein AB0395_34970 [Streptosporangium sp. NPDC051023]|uniref:hypothetical protein n=1 Tax=Streptosporangium sp. NPDC051023 TaxID=3155410 RepID=UPI00344CA44C